MAANVDEPGPAGHALDAIYTNRFSLRFQDGMVRLVFGDALVGKKAREHTSVIMSDENAVELAELILRLRKEHAAKRKT